MSTLNGRAYTSQKNLELKGQGNTRGGVLKFKGTNATNPLASSHYGLFVNSDGDLIYSKAGLQLGLGQPAEVVTAANTISAIENGKTFFLNSATEFASVLPAPFLGAKFKFVVSAAPSGADYTITTNGSANIVKGQILTSDIDGAADADSEVTGGDTISFKDGVAVAGDWVELISDGTNWFMTAGCKTYNAILITTAS